MTRSVSDTNVVEFFNEWASRRLDRESVDPHSPLTSLGLDSVQAAELMTILEDRYDTEITAEQIFDGLSLADVAELVGEQRDGSPAAGQSPETRTRSMEFSLLFFSSDAQRDESSRYHLFLESARFADAHGFQAVWMPERHFHSFGGLYPNPAVLGAALAASTARVRIRAGSVVLPLHNPVRVAEDWAVVDNLSGGRVDLAFATGWNADDFVLAPGNYAERVEVTRSGMDTVQRLWRGESLTLRTGVGEERAVRIFPAPVQPALPVWLTCSGGIERFEMAGAAGVNVLTALLFQEVDELAGKLAAYRAARARHGHAGEGTVTVMLHTFVGDSDAQVRRTVEGPFKRYLEDSVDLWRRGSEALESLDEKSRAKVLDFAFERYFRTNGLFGTPDSARAMVGRLRDIGVDEIACLIDFGIPDAEVLAGLGALAKLRTVSQSV
ncbi:MupA/Atu3671 family FMN-dependent luciferase-like monooxygenase [Nocardia huaxiensis]|uniref:LLM class flavin-dependent oxidoreductase n=1 Tax=Nocardia huaxiensis TaxID=2755382 RepID=A0A7D6ZJI2_9NOCA|nr:MupA/Atu3671 family FMN-dependent luciferase-like monooxygenase [Nocardia huaxiensis]QLY29243.1 LLM class flavin-dependent oxidoreductase [Nocardia huaxiensis]UFS97256.1 LLM class flavin-dependent oxidoreductase [Nocardia huaxiensis]